MLKTKYLILALSFALVTSNVMATNDIPVVPASVMKDNVPTPISSAKTGHIHLGNINDRPVLTMKPGVNQIVPIAIGHLNRFVTPFSEPKITTTSGAITEIRENVVYVSTENEVPVTMFVTEKGSEAQALNLTMIPRRIPPREIFLKINPGVSPSGIYANSKAERWEQGQPYIETIRSVFRTIALGEIPQGYTLSKIPPKTVLPSCDHPGLAFNFAKGQILAGHHLTILAGTAKNISNQAIEIKESLCGNWDVAAVAVWPLNLLEPGQQTEIYVAKKKKHSTAPSSKRPSLLGDRQ